MTVIHEMYMQYITYISDVATIMIKVFHDNFQHFAIKEDKCLLDKQKE